MTLWGPKKLFKATVPNLKEYLGRMITIPDYQFLHGKKTLVGEKRVKIHSICGNRFKVKFYEINGDHLINILRFHKIMEGDQSITESQIESFEDMDVEAEKLSTRKLDS